MVSLASEFPNDNPALHRGVIWVCTEPTGGARPERSSVSGEPPAQGELVVAAAEPEPAPPHAEETLATAAPSSDSVVVAAEPAELTSSAVEAEAPAPEEQQVKHDSLAPPEDELDDAADPIVVEELEPIEASVEGLVRDEAGGECAPPPVAIGATLIDDPVAAPAPAQSEVVLVGSRVHDEDDAAVDEPATPVFDEEVVASEVPCETTSLPPAPDDPFTMLVCTLADVAISAGSPHIASLLPGLLFDGRVSEPIDGATADALRAAGLWDGNDVSPAFVAVTAAWRAILRGTSDDFDACGAAMLDEWAADLLARLLEAPSRAPSLRQELRSRGVAAFGLAA